MDAYKFDNTWDKNDGQIIAHVTTKGTMVPLKIKKKKKKLKHNAII
jgi:hypothetical protein